MYVFKLIMTYGKMILPSIIFAVAICSISSYGEHRDDLPKANVTQVCLGCICYAVTNCSLDTTTPCTDKCGPLALTKEQWATGGSPKKNDTHETDESKIYVECVTDPDCAAEAQTAYFLSLGKDCNDDGRIDCWDYALLHDNPKCDHSSELTWWPAFNLCLDLVNKAGITDDML